MPTIRRAKPDDAAALARLAERTFRDTFTSQNNPADMERHCSKTFGSEIQLREIQSPDMITLLAEENGELIAFAQVRLHSAIECVTAKRPSELYRLYVSNRWQGRGIAHELMKEVLATVKRVASDRIWLGVWERNDRALAFYRKFGFDVVGDHVFQLGSDPQRDLVMAMETGATLTKLASEVASAELRQRGLTTPKREGRKPSVEESADALANDDLVAVARFLTPTEAHILAARLVAEGISAVVADANIVQANYLLSPAVGGVRVLVPKSQLSFARDVKAAVARGDYALPDDDKTE